MDQHLPRVIAPMRQTMLFAVAALILAAVIPRYYANLQPAPIASTRSSMALTTPASSTTSRGVTLRPAGNGLFQVAGIVDGQRCDFLAEPGAPSIALRESDAAGTGLPPAARDYPALSATANGVVRVAPVTLNRVEVSDIVLYNVAAVVIPDQS